MCRRSLSLFLGLSVLFLFSCNKEKKYGAYQLTFNLVSNGSPYTFSDVFQNSDGFDVKLESLRFYIAEVMFMNNENESFMAKDIELLTFSNEGIASFSVTVPPDSYQSISFGIGVPSAMNEADPSTYNTVADHPLSNTNNTYWGWTSMYRFIMLDGRFDTENDGDYEGLISIHTGYNDMYRTVSFEKAFETKKKSQNELSFAIEVGDIFDFNSSDKIQLDVENQYHGSTDAAEKDLSTRFSNNFSSAISLK